MQGRPMLAVSKEPEKPNAEGAGGRVVVVHWDLCPGKMTAPGSARVRRLN